MNIVVLVTVNTQQSCDTSVCSFRTATNCTCCRSCRTSYCAAYCCSCCAFVLTTARPCAANCTRNRTRNRTDDCAACVVCGIDSEICCLYTIMSTFASNACSNVSYACRHTHSGTQSEKGSCATLNACIKTCHFHDKVRAVNYKVSTRQDKTPTSYKVFNLVHFTDKCEVEVKRYKHND